MNMGEKINNILKGEIISSVFYILLGLCLILIPTQTVDVICKVVFGLILIGAGIYHIYIYIRGKAKARSSANCRKPPSRLPVTTATARW